LGGVFALREFITPFCINVNYRTPFVVADAAIREDVGRTGTKDLITKGQPPDEKPSSPEDPNAGHVVDPAISGGHKPHCL